MYDNWIVWVLIQKSQGFIQISQTHLWLPLTLHQKQGVHENASINRVLKRQLNVLTNLQKSPEYSNTV